MRGTEFLKHTSLIKGSFIVDRYLGAGIPYPFNSTHLSQRAGS